MKARRQINEVGRRSPFADCLDWPKMYIKRPMRLPLGERILSLISKLPHGLKQRIRRVASSSDDCPASLNLRQSTLEGYSEESKEESATDKKDQITGANQPDETDDSDTNDDDEDAQELADEDDKKVGIIYARVSSTSQTKDSDDENKVDSGSIEGQISDLEDIAERKGIELPYDPFVDKAKTGTNFDRDGIKRVFQVSLQNDIDYLLVEKVDRIGRHAPETLYYISKLQRECGVTLITQKGEQNIESVEGMMHTTLMSLMAEIQNTIRTKKATKERIRGFLVKKNWGCKSPIIPLGYTETDDGWLEVDRKEKQIVREIFEKFAECENYSATERYIEEKFGSQALDGYTIKTILGESVYIGRPKLPEEWLDGMSFENDLDEPELHLLRPEDDNRDVSEELFEQVQSVIAEKERTYSTDEETYTIEDFIDEFGLFGTVESSPPVKLIHHCGEPLVKNGQADLGGKYDITTHSYKCPACEEVEQLDDCYRKWPLQMEAEKMEIISDLLNGDNLFGGSDADSAREAVPDFDDN